MEKKSSLQLYGEVSSFCGNWTLLGSGFEEFAALIDWRVSSGECEFFAALTSAVPPHFLFADENRDRALFFLVFFFPPPKVFSF